jgi:hypothetical protein
MAVIIGVSRQVPVPGIELSYCGSQIVVALRESNSYCISVAVIEYYSHVVVTVISGNSHIVVTLI